jgi:hypothetical protein
MSDMPDKYSAYGFHKMGSLRVHHQGGLDTYCGLYSVLNLINFLYFEKDLSYLRQNPNIAEEAVQAIKARVGDFIGTDNPEVFKELVAAGTFNGLFPEDPFGGDGLDPPTVKEVLSRTLEFYKIHANAVIEEDESIYHGAPEQYSPGFRIGAERPFRAAADVLGIALVRQDTDDKIGHYVVLIGNKHLPEEMGIRLPADWNGIVLDSDRGYKFWKCENHNGNPFLQIKCEREKRLRDIYSVYSFISVSQM